MSCEDIIDRLIVYPLRSQIKVDFDLKKKTFHLSIPIFSSKTELPGCIKKYVEARANHTFKPYITFYKVEENRVFLIQEIPFSCEFQSTLRTQIDHFHKMGRHCSRILFEMAIEKKFEGALKFS